MHFQAITLKLQGRSLGVLEAGCWAETRKNPLLERGGVARRAGAVSLMFFSLLNSKGKQDLATDFADCTDKLQWPIMLDFTALAAKGAHIPNVVKNLYNDITPADNLEAILARNGSTADNCKGALKMLTDV